MSERIVSLYRHLHMPWSLNHQDYTLARRLGLCMALLLGVLGCTIKQIVSQPRPSGFIAHPERLSVRESLPFTAAWIAEPFARWQFGSVRIAAVRLDYLESERWIYSSSLFITGEQEYRRHLSELALYLEERLAQEFTELQQSQRLQSVKSSVPFVQSPSFLDMLFQKPAAPLTPIERRYPGSRTLRVEVAITAVDFGDPLLYGGLLAVPFPAAANLSSAARSPSITIEARFRDEYNEEILAEVLDRRLSQIKVIDLRRLWLKSAVRENADSFVEDLVALFDKRMGEDIADRSPISLLPW